MSRKPPVGNRGAVLWLRENLFSSVGNSVLTIVVASLLLWFLPPILDWAFFSADWFGTSREDCTSDGACWVFVTSRLDQFIYGFYPEGERWRVNLMFAISIVLLIGALYEKTPFRHLFALTFLAIFPFIGFFLLSGGVEGVPLLDDLPAVDTHLWGGLMLTLILASVGIVAALPLGILLALGRRSEMPLIRTFSVMMIEIWRGVPLITVLFMASVMFPLFVSSEVEMDKLLRALIGITFFQSAYIAEVVRGGLQAIPKGQYEAAQALGLGYWRMMALVIMPQALKLVIPGIVNTVNELFKDTSLVLIIGLFDLLAIVQAALNDPKWLGYATEGYLFAAFVFWIFCYGMSLYSRNLERKLDHEMRS
ncbi:amino acid ABC transporter permease [Pelagibaculum spongiae]|uniref:Amino acid ABC transporter permease n=1 Tax=Pelagibaculum spongiae TaxID=2080658 RepID=A0A2V1GQ02_9GAMM|nr:amino acid ABC transporter permease [Pelagibaculum spongiae]PVZ65483.1 amino acid ABC transporter permease [Pelagibaculum spongiae]